MKALLRWLFGFLAAWRFFGPIVAPRFTSPQRHPWPVEGRTVIIGSREFMVRQTGPIGAPDLVLIHGLGGSSLSEWYSPGRLLERHFRLTLVDHRSHGLSPKVTRRFEIEDVADDIAAVLVELGLTDADVVGYSMGGAIAQALAHRHAHLVHRLVLVATLAAHPPFHRRLRAASAWVIRGWERITGLGTPEVRWGYLMLTGSVERRFSEWLWNDTHRRDLEAGAAATGAMLRFDSRPWLDQIEQETLVVIPTHDQLVPPSWQYELAGLLKRVSVEEVAGARHELPWSHPRQLVGAVERFLRSS